MRKYKVARFLAWLLVYGGVGSTCIFVVYGILEMLTPIGAPFALGAAGAALGGLLLALIGFAFLAFFEAAEAYLAGQRRERV